MEYEGIAWGKHVEDVQGTLKRLPSRLAERARAVKKTTPSGTVIIPKNEDKIIFYIRHHCGKPQKWAGTSDIQQMQVPPKSGYRIPDFPESRFSVGMCDSKLKSLSMRGNIFNLLSSVPKLCVQRKCKIVEGFRQKGWIGNWI